MRSSSISNQIEPGEDFVEAINRKVGACEIAIVLLGPDWLRMTDASGRRRLDDPEDFVRMEIVSALQRKIRVIPVLVGGARMPRKEDLPEPLAPLSRRNAIELSEARFHADVDRLIEAMEKPRHLPVKETERPEAMPAPVAQAGRSSSDESRSRTNLFRMAMFAVAAVLIVAWLMWMGSARRSPSPCPTLSRLVLQLLRANRRLFPPRRDQVAERCPSRLIKVYRKEATPSCN